ncbi:hypothetical protein O181_027752 [Austropuccinia psidii MF-1]|uniref:Store-operated calcium entry-associated regulatory factor n=1 Tax=Austropuccinia psidii MF-1 TaxID=1389203 RepID=A0A9Q3H1Z5_9BASI|nr:hypothetical protein [Austropuccinia psidii MF-1]
MPSNQKILLSSIPTITFYDGEKTTHRRTFPVSQLTCKGPACSRFRPDVVQCYNQGGSGSEINWKCVADLPSNIKLGRVEVACEGWDHAADPYILKGSCGLTYTLKQLDSTKSSSTGPTGDLSITALIFWAIFLGVAFLILYPLLRSLIISLLPFMDRFLPNSSSGGGGPGGGGGGWGRGNPRFWGGGRPSDPPPPYSARDPPKPSAGEFWRPGFWTGLAAGSAATHLFQNRQTQPDYSENIWNPFTSSTVFSSPGMFRRSNPSCPRQGSSRDMDDSERLGPIRSSTGFGATRNR